MKPETPGEVKRWFLEAAAKLMPVSGGTVSLRKNRCIRKNCQLCRYGEGHPSYALHFRVGGRQHSLYLPDDLSEEMAQAVANGRKLKVLMVEAGRRYLKALKAERKRR
jgi:hypothetical protein